jgi:hypothetical protein
MSSPYSSIDRRINADKWFRKLSQLAKLLWFRLLTGDHVTPLPGLWPAREEGLASAFGFSLEQFRELFEELIRTPASNGRPRVIADWQAGLIWLPNSLKHPCNQPKNPNTLQSWEMHLDLLPECALKDEAIRHFADWVNSKPNRFENGWPYRTPNKDQDQDQDQQQDQEQEPQEGGGGAVLPFPQLVLEPRNLGEALKLSPRQRAQYASDHPDIASYLTPQRWPEVVALHAAVVTALKLPERPLQDWGRDRGLQALVRLLAVAEPDYVTRGAAALLTDPWWKARRRGLSDLSAEVLTRALGDGPDAESVSRLKAGQRQPSAFDHSKPKVLLEAIGATEV